MPGVSRLNPENITLACNGRIETSETDGRTETEKLY